RRLALLAVLAAVGERGRSRDQLLGLFWPDVSQSKARHSLEQLLYAIRTSLDSGAFIGVNPLRINPALIRSDVGDFAGALERGETEAAVEIYRGPFLDGFYLNDAPEFDQWVGAERARIERSYTEALERLARSAEEAKNPAAAARWLERLVATDAVSSKHAANLIRALRDAGDHGAALQYAERYEAIVRQELGTSVGPAVAALVAEVRQGARAESVVVRGAPLPRPPEREPAGIPAVASGMTAPVPAHETIAPPRPPDKPFVAPQRRTALYGIAALVLAAVIGSGWWIRSRAGEKPAPVAHAPSIAVLPLANLSGNASDAALVDGLSEALIGVLAKIERLRVVARTSAFVFKDSKLGARQIADSLRVSNILEGSVQKIGDRLRVQVRLVDARDGSTRWSETYDRELKDIFLVQSDIAAAVARELDLRLGGATAGAVRRGQTQNLAAYELYLRGNDPVLARNDTTVGLGVQYFKQAIALDSTYAAAYAGLARLTLARAVWTLAPDTHAQAKEAALRAVALDDSLAEGHVVLGAVFMRAYDFPAAERELRRAVTLDPGSSRARELMARFYHWAQRPADALAEANRALVNDPLSATSHAELALALCANGEYARGLAHLARAESVKPPVGRARSYRGLCHAMQREWLAVIARLSPPGRLDRGYLGHAHARAGQRKEATAILSDLLSRATRTDSSSGAFDVAIVYAGLGDYDRAFDWLDRSVEDGSLSPNIMLPLFDHLHRDPRFARFRVRLKLQTR
ncbi:MAG TPA: BTAD domain-containing putative transcriptional regulator, partial [Gemmatimonadaceae bacterium]|nr:BTAD domain-containing putative transcriptional regulator [Gemmatimonadaceae bacterium]